MIDYSLQQCLSESQCIEWFKLFSQMLCLSTVDYVVKNTKVAVSKIKADVKANPLLF